MTTDDLIAWVRPAITPTSVVTVFFAVAGGAWTAAWTIGKIFHSLLYEKADRSVVDDMKKDSQEVRRRLEDADEELSLKIRDLSSDVRKFSYDVSKALGALSAVHGRLDYLYDLLKANSVATLEIAQKVGAAEAALEIAKSLKVKP